MKGIKIAWTALFTLITIAVALAILRVGETKFQNVILAVLLELYAIIRSIGLGLVQLFSATERAHFAQFIELGKLLHYESSDAFADELKTATEKSKEALIRRYIEVAGLAIISLAATLRLFTILF